MPSCHCTSSKALERKRVGEREGRREGRRKERWQEEVSGLQMEHRPANMYTFISQPTSPATLAVHFSTQHPYAHLKTKVKLGADGTLQSECDVTAAVATVVPLGVVCEGGRRRGTLEYHKFTNYCNKRGQKAR